jgi:hypothetical protein
MASYRAIANGNWSATATWNVWNGSAWVAAVAVPSSADDVWANNFTVTIDQNVTILTLRNSVTGAPGTGTVAGGGILCATGTFTVNITNNVVNTNVNGALYIQTTGTANLTVTANFTATAAVIANCINCGTGSVLNIVGNISQWIATSSTAAITVNGTMNVVGFCFPNFTYYTGNGRGFFINSNGHLIVNGGFNFPTSSLNQTALVQFNGNNARLTINGDVLWETTSVQSLFQNVQFVTNTGVTNAIIEINGTILSNAISLFSIPQGSVFIHNGVLNGQFYGKGTTIEALGSILFLSGPIVCGRYGSFPFNCNEIYLSNNTSKYIEFRNSTNVPVPSTPTTPLPTMTMYSPNTIADAPAASNVRFGTVYALGSQTGTLRVPLPSQVSQGIQTDNTVGTAALTPGDVWNHLLANITAPNSIGDRLKNAATVDSTGDQIAALT